ncbi:hypothetical protein P9847_10935 [Paenibacillus chibensis]|uniref:DNA-binding protein n=1 Tax=Paenibacillus chibensis TaxID=59846 RepID=A0ABU6PSH0_9BACL|nr:hypothetical protein [Paenibacillus chibensis]
MIEEEDAVEFIDIDILVNMVKMAFAMENWEEVISLSTRLLETAKVIASHPSKTSGERIETKRHISYYFGYSYLMQGLAFQKLKQYALSIECIEYYRDLSWLNDSTDEAITIVEDFNKFAKANLLTLDILTGNRNKLPEYTEFLQQNPDQILSGLITILESAILYSYNVDHVLEPLRSHIRDASFYTEQVLATKYLSYSFMLALYYSLNDHTQEAIIISLHNLSLCDKLGNDKYFKKTIALFETIKIYASVSQLEEYSRILKIIFEGEISNEKGHRFSRSFSSSHFQ